MLLLFFASVYGQVSPGDEDQRCMNQITTPYGENVMMLMNSRHYMQLLDESGAVWDAEDYDDNNNDNLYNPTSVSYLGCNEYLTQCDFHKENVYIVANFHYPITKVCLRH